MALLSAAKLCIINTTIHYVPLLDLVPIQGRKQYTFESVFWNNRQCVLERCEEENWSLFFHPSSLKHPLKLTIWSDVNPGSTIIGFISGSTGYTGFHLARKKETELILNRKRKRYLMKARDTSCLNPLTRNDKGNGSVK